MINKETLPQDSIEGLHNH